MMTRFAYGQVHRIAAWALQSVQPGLLAGAGWAQRLFFWRPEARLESLVNRSYAASDRGRSEAAATAASRMLDLCREYQPLYCPWLAVNAAIDVLVNAGRYRLAVEAAQRWSPDALEWGQHEEPRAWAYCLINLAEAHHCLGENERALAQLEAAEPHCQDDPLGTNGLRTTRAWLLAHLGRAAEARAVLSTVPAEIFGVRYRAEYHYTRALVARALSELDLAEQETREGLACARRASSRRNGFLSLAAAALDRGELDRAIDALEFFARHPYRGQSGPGLLLLGTTYERAGRMADARAAYGWVIERDPESAAATTARQRLPARPA